MTKERLNIIKKVLRRTCWIIAGGASIFLFGSAMIKKSDLLCSRVEISINGAHNNIFIDEKDVEKILMQLNDGKLAGLPVKSFDLSGIAETLERNVWIKKAQIYFDNNEVLWVNITEREPIARIFTSDNNSFYIDTSTAKIPLSEKFSARLPVFTGYAESKIKETDSLLLNNIKNLSTYILADSFWMAQIDQINITPQGAFEIIPKVGNQVILFGNADDYQEKFTHLFEFYKQVLSKVGWNKYSTVDLQYKGQIVTTKRGVADVKMDSLKTAQIMNMILLKAQMQLADSTGIQLVQNDEAVQQVVPLVNADLPEENLMLINLPKLRGTGELTSGIIKDSVHKTVKDTALKPMLRIKPIQTKVPEKKAAVKNTENNKGGAVKNKKVIKTDY